jgi:hypothetical protein
MSEAVPTIHDVMRERGEVRPSFEAFSEWLAALARVEDVEPVRVRRLQWVGRLMPT